MANKKKSNTDNDQVNEKEMRNQEEQLADENLDSGKTLNAEQSNPEPEASVTAEEKLAAELKDANDKYLRLYAEFDNYKRRIAKERIELMQTAGKDIIASLLPIIDDFERALKAIETATEISAVKEGVSLVSHKLKNTLALQGLKEMESIGKPFDADLQEAITSIPAPNEDQKGKVIDEIEKGYYLHDKVLRHAKVVVGN